jgi:hypothetical protein
MSAEEPQTGVLTSAEQFRRAVEATRRRGDLRGEREYREAGLAAERRQLMAGRLELAWRFRQLAASAQSVGDTAGALALLRRAESEVEQAMHFVRTGTPLRYVHAADVSDWEQVRPGLWYSPSAQEPRHQESRPGSGAAAGGSEAAEASPRRPPKPRGKRQGRLARFRSPAVRRRVLHGLRNEAELAAALSAHNLPDSEPADVVLLADPQGEIITDPQRVKDHLRRREIAVDFLRRWEREPGRGPNAWDLYEKARSLVEDFTLHFFEVKTLIVQRGAGAVHMSSAAVSRKNRWSERYAAPFHTVAFDDRRGHKHSGHRLYYRRGVGSANPNYAYPQPEGARGGT